MVLYAAERQIRLGYIRRDNVAGGEGLDFTNSSGYAIISGYQQRINFAEGVACNA